MTSTFKPPTTIRARGGTGTSDTLRSQKSKHGFYDEFSVLPQANDSTFKLRKGTKSTWERINSSFKPAPDQSRCDKCNENMQSCFNRNCLFNLLPILLWLPKYKFDYLKKDLMAGITVSILLVPQSLAYATLAGLPPEWGLYASVMPILFYTFWSTSCAVAVGPVAPTAIMVASAVDAIMNSYGVIESDPQYDTLYQSICMTLSFVCGFILIVFGLIRAGFIIVFLSRPVMNGFIMSAAFIIFVNQLRGLMGLDMSRYPLFYETLIAVFESLDSINLYTTLISAISLFILFLPKCCLKGKIPKWVPIPLIVIVMWILISYFCDLQRLGVSIIGNQIQSGFPTLKAPNFDYIGDVFAGAIVVSIVSYMGSIALAKGFDQKRRETYKQEYNLYNTYLKLNPPDNQIELVMQPSSPQENENGQNNPSMNVVKTTESISPNTISANDGNNTETNALMSAPSKTFSMQSTEDEDGTPDPIGNTKKPKAPPKPLSIPPIDLNPNVEFIAYGIANLLGSFFSSQVISASFSRSALNFDMNGWTQVSSFIQAFICLLCLLFLMAGLSPLPKCVLASLVTVSVYRLIKNGIHEFIFLCRVSRIELIEFAVASIAPLVIGLEIGIFLAIGTSILVNLLRHSFTSIIFLGRLNSTMSDEAEYVDCAMFKEAKVVPHITIVELKAELSFSNNNRLVDKLRRLLQGGNKYIVVSLNLTSFIDTTAIRQIVTIFEDAKGSYICLSQCRPKVIELIKRYEKDNTSFPENVKTFISTHDAVLYLNSLRTKLRYANTPWDSEDDSISSFGSKPSMDHIINTVTPQMNFATPGGFNKDLSDLEMTGHSIRRHTYSFRAAGRNVSTSNRSNVEAVGTDSGDDTEENNNNNNKQQLGEKNENDKEHKILMESSSGNNEDNIEVRRWSNSLPNIDKIDEDKAISVDKLKFNKNNNKENNGDNVNAKESNL